MGGIVGFIDFSGSRGKDELKRIARVMASAPPPTRTAGTAFFSRQI